MAGKGDAMVIVGADASAVKKAAAETVSAWKDVGRSLSTEIGNATTAIINDLGRVVTAQGQVNFSKQHQDVRAFEAATAHMAAATGRDLETIRKGAENTGLAIGKQPTEVNAWAASVGQLTGNFQGAEKAIRGVSEFAAKTNRSVEDYRGLAVELQNVGQVGGDTSHALGVLTAQANMLGTVGGPAALADQIVGLQDVISRFAVHSESDFLKVSGAAAVFGKGLNQAAAGRVQQQIFGTVANINPYLMKRMLGHSVVDEHGQMKDAVGTALELRDFMVKKYGRERAIANMSMMGMSYEGASALVNANAAEVRAAGNAKPSEENKKALQTYLGSDAGKRDEAQAQLAVSSRQLLGSATALGKAADALQQFAAKHPVASTVASGAAAGILGAGAAAVGKSVTLGIRSAMSGTAAGIGKGAAFVGGTTVAGIATLVGAGAAGVYGIHKFDQAEQEREKLNARAADVAAQSSSEQRQIAMKHANAAAHALVGLTPAQRGAAINATTAAIEHAKDGMAALQLSHGGATAMQQLVAAMKSQQKQSGLDDASIDKLARALASAMQGATMHVVSDENGPVAATRKNTHSSSAGSQAHP